MVFHDQDRDGVHDDGEEGLAGIRVSNGRQIVRTDHEGRYRLPIDDDTILFVIKPRGWMTPVNEDKLPRFLLHPQAPRIARVHAFRRQANRAPARLGRLPVEPAGAANPVSAPVLRRHPAAHTKEVEYITHDVIEQVVAEKSTALAGGDPRRHRLRRPLGDEAAEQGDRPDRHPWYNVLGNHDINHDAKDDKHSDETFESHYGPSYYSFDHGTVHFLVLDDVAWTGAQGRGAPGPLCRRPRRSRWSSCVTTSL